MLTIRYHNTFKKDYRRVVGQGYDIHLLEQVVQLLAEQKTLPQKYKDHDLMGDQIGYRECQGNVILLLVGF